MYTVFVIIALLVVVGFIVFAAVRFLHRQARHQDEVKSAPVDTLRYRVPEGQDPAIVLAALQKEGFKAIPDVQGAGPSHDVLIPCPDDTERHRAHVRSIIQSTEQVNFEGDQRQIPQVKFADE
ncbi:MAG TPA: hypothetical protein VI452_17015 [Marmoricola sp.]